MNDQPELKFRKTLEDIRLHFGFLFKRGYRLGSVLFAGQTNDDWQVTLSEGNRLVHIYSEQGIVNLIMSTLLQANEVVYFDMEASSNLEFFYTIDEFPITESQQLQKIGHFLETNLTALLAQAEKDNLPSIERPVNRFAVQQKRKVIFIRSPSVFFITSSLRDYSFTSPSITSPSFDEGVEGPPDASG